MRRFRLPCTLVLYLHSINEIAAILGLEHLTQVLSHKPSKRRRKMEHAKDDEAKHRIKGSAVGRLS